MDRVAGHFLFSAAQVPQHGDHLVQFLVDGRDALRDQRGQPGLLLLGEGATPFELAHAAISPVAVGRCRWVRFAKGGGASEILASRAGSIS